jgi:hypothetical protein
MYQERSSQEAAQLPSGQSKANYEIQTSSSDAVTVSQTILPIKNAGYLSGDTARMFVEIKNNKRMKNIRYLNELAIRVIIDDELGIIPDSARWLKVYSLEDLCKIKTELYTCPLDENPLISCANRCQNNIQLEYYLININNAKLNNSTEVSSIADRISDVYDMNWIDADDLKIYKSNNSIIINNSMNDSYAIFHSQKDDTIEIVFSDGRSYNLFSNISNGNTYLNYTNTIIGFNAGKLSPKESIILYYDMKPKKTGIFNTEVIVRAYDPELSHLQDLSFFSKIEVKDSNPKFEIKPRTGSLEATTKDPIDVYYDITYMGGASEPYCENIPIKFDPPKNERYYVNEKGIRDDTLHIESNFKNYSNFYMHETISIPMRVAFSTKGSYPLPGLSVNGIHYSFNEEKINVDTWFFKHLDIIFLLVATFSLIFTALELFRTRGELRDLSTAKLIICESNKIKSTIMLGKNKGDEKN